VYVINYVIAKLVAWHCMSCHYLLEEGS